MIWEDELDPDYPAVKGEIRLMRRWDIYLSYRHNISRDGPYTILFRPGFVARMQFARSREPWDPRKMVASWRAEIEEQAWDLEFSAFPYQYAMSYQTVQATAHGVLPALHGLVVIPWEMLYWESVLAKPETISRAKGIFYTIRAIAPTDPAPGAPVGVAATSGGS